MTYSTTGKRPRSLKPMGRVHRIALGLDAYLAGPLPIIGATASEGAFHGWAVGPPPI